MVAEQPFARPERSGRHQARKGGGAVLREEILVAAERLLIETGSEDQVSIRAVAAATGVTAPSIYRHFEDKTHLIFEVCARQFALFDRALQEAVADDNDPISTLYASGRAYVRFGIEHPEHYRIMFMGPAYATPDQWEDLLATGSFAHLISTIEAGVDANVFEPIGDPFTTALHVWACIHGLTSLLIARPTMPWPDVDGFIDEHLSLVLEPYLKTGPSHR
ncbi:MAG: TetR-like C-terminal domain-containing protein [Acidimicrobiales bacterium]